ncbi:MAG: DNA recombination protein RmuC, partial [Bacteroidales bacterium]|nr:DNA recombination protein RmuC [Bacteroidales bacterium]
MSANLLIFIVGICGIILGAGITFLVLKARNSAVQANLEAVQSQLDEEKKRSQADLQKAEANFNRRIEEVKADEQKHCQDTIAAKEKANDEAMQTLKLHYEQSIKEQQERFDKTVEGILVQNKAATEDLLKARQEEFAKSSTTSIGLLVNPLKETIAKMEESMQKSSKDAIDINSAMRENLRQMMDQSKAAQAITEELVNSFKHKSKTQGDWGEAVLSELLQSQGLTEGVHYDTQATIRDSKGMAVKSEDNKIMRPDVILHLDSTREVIIDSKVSLTAFFDYVNAENEEDRNRSLQKHIDSINGHVKELSKKDYSSYIQPPKVRMNYVIMFVPHTGALWTALNAQPDLWRKAMEQNVYIADEQS